MFQLVSLNRSLTKIAKSPKFLVSVDSLEEVFIFSSNFLIKLCKTWSWTLPGEESSCDGVLVQVSSGGVSSLLAWRKLVRIAQKHPDIMLSVRTDQRIRRVAVVFGGARPWSSRPLLAPSYRRRHQRNCLSASKQHWRLFRDRERSRCSFLAVLVDSSPSKRPTARGIPYPSS